MEICPEIRHFELILNVKNCRAVKLGQPQNLLISSEVYCLKSVCFSVVKIGTKIEFSSILLIGCYWHPMPGLWRTIKSERLAQESYLNAPTVSYTVPRHTFVIAKLQLREFKHLNSTTGCTIKGEAFCTKPI